MVTETKSSLIMNELIAGKIGHGAAVGSWKWYTSKYTSPSVTWDSTLRVANNKPFSLFSQASTALFAQRFLEEFVNLNKNKIKLIKGMIIWINPFINKLK